eukprot:3022328-Pyramimonas_sp.AAC.1
MLPNPSTLLSRARIFRAVRARAMPANRATRGRHLSSSAALSASWPHTSRAPTSAYRRNLEGLKGRASLAHFSDSGVVA